MDPIASIFHEKQEGLLCAQHCLNTLLQGQYFSPVDLAEIARQLDDCERERMAEGGTQTDEYINFMEQPSSNFDDSGFFSIQVISSALRVWSLEVVPFNSQDEVAVAARNNPVDQKAFICNFRDHWFTIRKLGRQWFNLNSLLTGPELISDTYLSLFLTQLQQEGYSIFVLIGNLPASDADEILKIIQVEQPIKPPLITDKSRSPAAAAADEGVDDEMERALAESKALTEKDDRVLQQTLNASRSHEDEALLRRALEMSMLEMPSTSGAPGPSSDLAPRESGGELNLTELRNRRLEHLSRYSDSRCDTPSTSDTSTTETRYPPIIQPTSSLCSTEDEMLQAAIKLSMEQP